MGTKRRYRVGHRDDFAADSMTEVGVGDGSVLVVRRGDAFTALAPRCPHYGAPLEAGVLAGSRIVCPWHHACFDATTGARLEPPALDPLHRYAVRLEGDEVFVDLEPVLGEAPAANRAADPRHFVICGGGAAGAQAAITLRREGFDGRVTMVTSEAEPPYDRTFLTKELLQGAELPAPLHLRPSAWWREHGIELRTGTTVQRIDRRQKRLALADGATLAYDKALLCTGAAAKRLPVPGADLAGVRTLRSLADMQALLAAVVEPVVVVGGSFIACEAAWSLRERGLEVALVTPEPWPFAQLFGERVGRRLAAVHAELGVDLHLGRHVEHFRGNGRLEALVLDDGRRLTAGTALVGVGVAPRTAMLDDDRRDADGGVTVDDRLRVDADLFAAGDIARFPLAPGGAPVRIEHWRLAQQHGELAARNMLGADTAYAGVPFFWSAQQLALYYVGHAGDFDDVVFDGEPTAGGAFLAYYLRDGRVTAALGVERNAEMAALEELLRRRVPLRHADVAGARFDPRARLREVLTTA